MKNLINPEEIFNKIYFIRGQKVMLDRDLAQLYGVETKRLKEQVKRNIKRFPRDFMIELTKEEFENWRSQIATSNSDKMGLRHAPMAFTEQGVAMLSSVLNSDRAIDVNIQIMRAFIEMRKIISTHDELNKIKFKIDKLEKKYYNHDEPLKIIFDTIKKMLVNEEYDNKIGFE